MRPLVTLAQRDACAGDTDVTNHNLPQHVINNRKYPTSTVYSKIVSFCMACMYYKQTYFKDIAIKGDFFL